MDDLEALLGASLPRDHARQSTVEDMFARLVAASGARIRVLDLGCGAGPALAYFERFDGRVDYVGTDIADSPEVRSRSISDPRFTTYDGINLPFEDGRFDCVYSKQVFEHVLHPRRLLPEVLRVLKPGGRFVASASFLEPYHSYSLFGFTPYGVKTLLEEAGFEDIRLRPGVDGITLSLRSILPWRRTFDRWLVSESPFNRLLDRRGRRNGWSIGRTAAAKLRIAGHIVFEGNRPG